MARLLVPCWTVLCLTLVVSLISGEQLYFASVPRLARPGQRLDVSLTFLPPLSRRALVKTFLMGTGENYNKTYSRVYRYFDSSSFDPLQLRVPFNTEANAYRVVISSSRGFTFEEETTVSVDKKILNGYVQTDKGMYNPGNLVQYRILSLDQNSQAYSGKYDVIIYDAGRNRIKQDLGVSDRNGLIRGELQLSSEPVLGEWQISVSTEWHSFSKTFEVRKYVLPRFSVDVTPVKAFAVITDPTVDVAISAAYTSGKPIQGAVSAVAKVNPWYYWRDRTITVQPSLEKSVLVNADGNGEVSFSIEELQGLDKYLTNKRVQVEVIFTDPLTGETATGSTEVQVHQFPEKVEFVSSNPKTFKPDLQYTGYVKVVQQDGTPFPNPGDYLEISARVEIPVEIEEPEILPVKPVPVLPIEPVIQEEPLMIAKRSAENEPLSRRRRQLIAEPVRSFPIWNPYPPTKSVELPPQELKVPASGIVEFSFDIPDNATSLSLTAKYANTSRYNSAKRFYSKSDSYLQIKLLTNLPQAGDRIEVDLRSNVEFGSFHYMVLSRGRNVLIRTFNRYTSSNTARISFTAKPEMGPTARLVAYFLVGDEFVADGISFNVRGAFKNKVTMEFDAAEVRPGDNVNAFITADPGSLVSTLLVDKSVILLKPGFDLSFSQISDDLGRFDVGSNSFPTYYFKKRRKRLSIWPYPGYGSSNDAKAIFDDAGIKTMTNGLIYNYEPPFYPYPEMRFFAQADFAAVAMASESVQGGLAQVERIRERFIETWLFNVVRIGWSGQRVIPLKAPDTITTFVGTAFALDRSAGFGMTEAPTNVVVLKKFYANVILPYSVIRGEHVLLQVNVFNYYDSDETVVVELKDPKGYECLNIDSSGNVVPAAACSVQTVLVKSNSVASVFFPLVATQLGEVDITVTARSTQYADGLTKTLRVQAEGIPQEYNQAVIVDLIDTSTYSSEIEVAFPPDLIEGSERVIVKVLGDLMSNTLNGLSKLIKMSYGCGEQNMINFAPTVFVSNYLDSVGQLTGERKSTTLEIIRSGYQRQMNYMRRDGSFSAFGDRDPSGSTWLSLFVWKSFRQANALIQIDEGRLAQTLDFIKRQQSKDGSFLEPGRVIHRDMQGGSSSGLALTAYALTALAQGNTDGSLDDAVDLSRKYVEDRILDLNDTYVLTICAYALELSGSQLLPQVCQKLQDAATNENGYVFWQSPNQFIPTYRWRCPQQRSNAGDIEATAYALLSCVKEGDVGRCLTILPWLVGQQNSNGGFVSTQDTVMAVQALSSVGRMIYSEDNSVAIQVTSGGSTKKFNVNQSNRFLQQTAILNSSPGNVQITGTGKGRVVVQLSVRYNIEEEYIKPAFTLNVTTSREENGDRFGIDVCVAHIDGTSGMAYVDVNLPTGYSAVDSTEKDLYIISPRVEVSNKNVIVYFNEIESEETCFRIEAQRTGLVAKLKPVTVTVIDYYEPDQKCVAYYLPEDLAEGDFCDICDTESCPVCANRKR